MLQEQVAMLEHRLTSKLPDRMIETFAKVVREEQQKYFYKENYR